MSLIKRHPIRLTLALAALLLAWWAGNNRADLAAFPDILPAYTAKEYCSCRYVMANSAEYCAGYVKQWLPISHLLDEQNQKLITVRALGRTQQARWLSPREGCQLQ